MARRSSTQLALPPPRTWGGRREGAGRKKTTSGLPHVPRPAHVGRHPVHVTLRARRDVPNLRRPSLARAIERTLRAATTWPRAETFRVVQFSIQRDHLHFLVEAADREALARGMQGLLVWIARRVN